MKRLFLYFLILTTSLRANDPWSKQDILLETAYQIMTKFLKNNLNDFDNFITGLKKVRLLRVEVPHDTDLNHYFEIMNSRGEQLEKHEIIKAHCMSVLQKSPNLKNSQNSKRARSPLV